MPSNNTASLISLSILKAAFAKINDMGYNSRILIYQNKGRKEVPQSLGWTVVPRCSE
jgi:hypothetical protein